LSQIAELLDATVADFKKQGDRLLGKVTDPEDIAVVERQLRFITQTSAKLLVAEPAERANLEQDMRLAKGTLDDIAAKVSLSVQTEVSLFVAQVFSTAVTAAVKIAL